MQNNKYPRIYVIFVMVSILLASCAQTSSPASTTEAPAKPAEPVSLKIAVLPILDNLPMYVADQEGLFAKHNVKVEFIPVASAAERDQLIAAGQADGMINELVSTIFYNKDQIQIQVVRFARVATKDYAQFHILVSGNSGITDVQGLKGVEIGVSQGTVIEYLTDRLLESQGFNADDIKTIAVPKIPDRMSLLASGELKAGMLPDPLSFLAEQQGAKIILDDRTHPEYAYSVISFRKPFIDQNLGAIKNFLIAVEEATILLNNDPTKYSNLLSDKKLVPAPLMGTYKVGPFPTKGIPSQQQWDDVLAWAKGKGLLSQDVSYAESVTPAFLP